MSPLEMDLLCEPQPAKEMDILSDTPSPPHDTYGSENHDNGDLIDLKNDFEGWSPLPSPVTRNAVLPCAENGRHGGEFEREDDENSDYDAEDSDEAEEEYDEFSTTKTSSDAIVRRSENIDTPPIQQAEMYEYTGSTPAVLEDQQRVLSPIAREHDAGEQEVIGDEVQEQGAVDGEPGNGEIPKEELLKVTALEEEWTNGEAGESKLPTREAYLSGREADLLPVVEFPLNAPCLVWNPFLGCQERPFTPKATSAETLLSSPFISSPFTEAGLENSSRREDIPGMSEASNNNDVAGQPETESEEARPSEDWFGRIIGDGANLNPEEIDVLQEEFENRAKMGRNREAFEQEWDREVKDIVVNGLVEELASMPTGSQLDHQPTICEADGFSSARMEYREQVSQADLLSEPKAETIPEEVWHEPIVDIVDPRTGGWITLPQTRLEKKKLLVDIFLHCTAAIFPCALKLDIKDIFAYHAPSTASKNTCLLGISEEVWDQLFTTYDISRLIKAQHKKLRAETLARTKAVIEEWYVTEGFQKLPETPKERFDVLNNELPALRKAKVKALLETKSSKSQRWFKYIFQLDDKALTAIENRQEDLLKNVLRLVERCFENEKSLLEEIEEINKLKERLTELVEKELVNSFARRKIDGD